MEASIDESSLSTAPAVLASSPNAVALSAAPLSGQKRRRTSIVDLTSNNQDVSSAIMASSIEAQNSRASVGTKKSYKALVRIFVLNVSLT